MKNERIQIRSTTEEKKFIDRAAELKGVSTSVFIREAAVKLAKKTVQENEEIELNNRDGEIFLQALDNPPEPNADLKKAMKEFRKWKK